MVLAQFGHIVVLNHPLHHQEKRPHHHKLSQLKRLLREFQLYRLYRLMDNKYQSKEVLPPHLLLQKNHRHSNLKNISHQMVLKYHSLNPLKLNQKLNPLKRLQNRKNQPQQNRKLNQLKKKQHPHKMKEMLPPNKLKITIYFRNFCLY